MARVAGPAALGALMILALAALAPHAGAQEDRVALEIGAKPTNDCSGERIWCFDKDALNASAGQEVEVTFRNTGDVAHSFCIALPGGERCTPDPKQGTPAGQSASLLLQLPPEGGSFPYWCDVPGHRDSGMEGTFRAALPEGTEPVSPTPPPPPRAAPFLPLVSILFGVGLLALALRRR